MKKLFFIFFACLSVFQTNAQFYYQGRGAADQKWKQIKAKEYKLVYPDYYEKTALRMSGYLDSVMPYIRYGMTKPILKIPIVLETQNQLSNGMVTWAPKREELVPTAPPNIYAQSWLKQLSVHEFRHVTQISNLKSGLSKIASWIFGEAGLCVGLLVISDWELEGDATNAETQLAEFGRGLQPSFTIEYRAMTNETNFKKYTADQLIVGSYNKFYPNIYQYGYQIVRATETYTKPDIWGDIYKYSGKWPIFIVPDDVYLKHHYKLTIGKISKRAYGDLADFWKPLSAESNSYQTITKPSRSYTTYETPIALGGGSIVVQKRDFDTPNYLVSIDSCGNERNLLPTGSVSSRIIYKGGFLYWTEYQSSLSYEKKNYSVIRSCDLSGKSRKSYLPRESNYFVTPLDSGFATVKNDSLSNGYIQFYDEQFNKLRSHRFDIPTTLHGLAWDSVSGNLAFIALDDDGMWLGALRGGKVEVLRDHSVVTISELRAQDGKFYYGSIESGKDEIHSFDLRSGVETRLTTSKYGAIQGCADEANLYLATYTVNGWLLGLQSLSDSPKDTVLWSRLPQDRVNYPWVKWDIDKAKVDTIAMSADTTSHDIKRFRRLGRRFNFHSWAPIATDLGGILGERDFRLGFGGTGFFQSTLGDMYGSLSLGSVWGRFWGLADFVYSQLPVQFAVRAEYGGGDQLVYGANSSSRPISLNDYFSLRLEAFAPMKFSTGAVFRTLTPRFGVTHYNAQMYDSQAQTYSNGLQRWDASVSWNVSRRTSYRDLKPRLGYAVLLGAAGAFTNDFSLQYTSLLRGYLPGILPNHSITLNASYQTQQLSRYNFTGKTLRVRGVQNNYAAQDYVAATFDYTFPVCYPDFGISGVLYFKRISLNLFADYSYGRYFNIYNGLTNLSYCSAGFDLEIDFSIFRSFDQGIVFSFAFPKSNPMVFSVGYKFGF